MTEELPLPDPRFVGKIRLRKISKIEPNGCDTAAGSTSAQFKLVNIHDFQLDDEPLWLIDDLIPAGPSLGVFFGRAKAGKTFLVADLFYHVALGRAYLGHTARAGAVVYISIEGVRGFRRRMLAMRKHRNPDGPVAPFFAINNAMPNFGAMSGDAERLAEAIKAAIPAGITVAAVILDTLTRSLQGASDNDSADMSAFVANCDALARELGCFIGAIHHSPRGDDTRSRGSNVLDGAADVIVSVSRDEATGISTATIEAMKDGDAGASWSFRLIQIDLESDGTRNKKTCCAPTCATVTWNPKKGDGATSRNRKLSPSHRRFIDILSEAILDHGVLVPGSITVPAGTKAVTREQLKKCLLDKGFLDPGKDHSNRTIFSRVLNDLAGRYIIGTTAERVWLPK